MWKATGWLVGLCAVVVTVFGANTAWADAWDHVHLIASDTKAAAEWYAKHFDGKVTKAGQFDAVLIGGQLIKFKKGSGEVKGSVGSAADHIAISVADFQAKVTALREAGLDVKSISRRVKDVATLTDPWGTKVEVVLDEDHQGLHHVHLRSLQPLAAARWYESTFAGGELTRFRGVPHLPAVRYGKVMVVIQQGRADTAPTDGRAIDHIALSVDDFDAAVAKLKAKDTTFLVEPMQSGDSRIAFIEGPDGVKVELVGKG